MKKIVYVLFMVIANLSLYAQNADEKDLLPSSELDIAYHRIGSSVKVETFVIENPAKYMVTKAMIVTDMETGEVKSGLHISSFTTTGLGGTTVWYHAYLDMDEIDRCIDLLASFQKDYLNKPADEVQTAFNYNSRSGALIGVGTDQKEWTVYIKPVASEQASTSYFKQKDLPKVIKMFEETKNILDQKVSM